VSIRCAIFLLRAVRLAIILAPFGFSITFNGSTPAYIVKQIRGKTRLRRGTHRLGKHLSSTFGTHDPDRPGGLTTTPLSAKSETAIVNM
jgi:hypothetical protein